MRLRATFVLLAVLLPIALACSSAGVRKSERVEATLVLVSTVPPLDQPLDASVTIVATLQYSIVGFRAGDFFISPQFDKVTPGDTTDGSGELHRAYPDLKSPSGEVVLSHSIGKLLARPDVTKPLRLRYFLHERTGVETSRVAAKTEPIVLKAIVP